MSCPGKVQMKIRILLVDDHTIFRQALATLLQREPDFDVEADCGSATEALLLLQTRRPDVMILDVDLGEQRGSDLLQAARRSGYIGPVVVLTAGALPGEEAVLLRNGVACVLRKDVSSHILSAAIRQAVRLRATGSVHDVQIPSPRKRDTTAIGLTKRESDVLRYLIEGCGNKEIAAELQSSESAVKGIVQQLFHKTGTSTRSQLVLVALEHYRVRP